MSSSTVTGKGQTTFQQEIREALSVAPRQCLFWEVRKVGSSVVRPMPSVMELAGSLTSQLPFTSIRKETEAATTAWVAESGKSNRR